jgi:serine/threonine protein kinase
MVVKFAGPSASRRTGPHSDGAAMAVTATVDIQTGKGAENAPRLAPYRFVRKLMETDFSHIWLAEDPALQRPVAVKLFRPNAGEDGIIPPFPVAEWRRRFVVDARILSSFDHPNIMPVYRLDWLDADTPCMVMQYMSGSLHLEIGSDDRRNPPVAPPRVRQILLETLSALAVLHARGLVHRDVKPLNLLLADGPGSRLKLTDLGMVKTPDEPSSERSIWIGTRDYISPEQYENATLVTDRADIYSVGVLALRLLRGHLPDGQPPHPVEGMPPALAALVGDAMAERPERRPSAVELARRLTTMRL